MHQVRCQFKRVNCTGLPGAADSTTGPSFRPVMVEIEAAGRERRGDCESPRLIESTKFVRRRKCNADAFARRALSH